jgi:CRISPR type III-B/RAMP module RAMP protein Cmr6
VGLLGSVAESPASEAYTQAFARWRDLQSQRPDSRVFRGILATPLAVGLGNESPLEAGLTLHHIYGMPVIPGSALKGLCRRAAIRLRAAGGMSADQFAVLFGNDEGAARGASYLVFWDAWYDPDSVDRKPLKRDVVTVHHPRYYQEGGQAWPTDFDDPNPVPFVVVRPKARFLFALSAPSAEWRDYSVRLLQWALVHLGVGAKTNAGHGYFEDTWEHVSGSRLAAATPEEVWPQCLLRREIVKGAVRVHVQGGPEPLVVEQSEWQSVERALPEAQREILRRGRPVRALVRIRREGQRIRLVGVEIA